MININELRIGSIISMDAKTVLPHPHRITAKDIFDISEGKITLSALEGLHLSHGLLMISGFTKDLMSDTYYIMDGNMKIEVMYDDSDAPGICGDWRVKINGHLIIIDDFHNLQTLYYLLTDGKELDVKI